MSRNSRGGWLNYTQSDSVVGVEEPTRGSLVDVMMSDKPGAARNLFASYESGTVLTSEYGRFGIYPLLILMINFLLVSSNRDGSRRAHTFIFCDWSLF